MSYKYNRHSRLDTNQFVYYKYRYKYYWITLQVAIALWNGVYVDMLCVCSFVGPPIKKMRDRSTLLARLHTMISSKESDLFGSYFGRGILSISDRCETCPGMCGHTSHIRHGCHTPHTTPLHYYKYY